MDIPHTLVFRKGHNWKTGSNKSNFHWVHNYFIQVCSFPIQQTGEIFLYAPLDVQKLNHQFHILVLSRRRAFINEIINKKQFNKPVVGHA
jgi:hypothetical protein